MEDPLERDLSANVLWIHPPERGGFQKQSPFLFLWIPLQPNTAFQRALSPKPSPSRHSPPSRLTSFLFILVFIYNLLPELDLFLQSLDLLNSHRPRTLVCRHMQCGSASEVSFPQALLFGC